MIVWSVFAVKFFALYNMCNSGLQTNAIRIMLCICLRSVIWIGLDLGQHLGHHCGLGWVGLGHRVDGLDWISKIRLMSNSVLSYKPLPNLVF